MRTAHRLLLAFTPSLASDPVRGCAADRVRWGVVEARVRDQAGQSAALLDVEGRPLGGLLDAAHTTVPVELAALVEWHGPGADR